MFVALLGRVQIVILVLVNRKEVLVFNVHVPYRQAFHLDVFSVQKLLSVSRRPAFMHIKSNVTVEVTIGG